MDERIKEDVRSISNRDILIDSCVLIYWGDNKHKDFSKKLLRQLANNENRLAISEFSAFEVIKNCENKTNFNSYIGLLNYIENRDVTREVLVIAATLHTHYSKKHSLKGNVGCLAPGDLVIGATAAEVKALLLTCNISDFPEPTWKIIAQTYDLYEDGRKKMAMNYYLIEFNINEVKETILKNRLEKYIV